MCYFTMSLDTSFPNVELSANVNVWFYIFLVQKSNGDI